jgi:hypothetical protein
MLEAAREEGLKEGIERGIEKGRIEGIDREELIGEIR